MLASGAVVEKAATGAIKAVQAIKRVLGRMRMHHVQQNVNAMTVRNVDQLLQLVWSSETANLRTERLSTK